MPTSKGTRLRHDPLFPSLKETVISRTGLAYWGDKDDVLAEALARLLETSELRPEQLAVRLEAERGTGPVTSALTDAVTVGETSFFRYGEQFDALERVVLPDVLWRKRRERTLGIWSAGCSNGAEPYSLSIMLQRNFAVALTGWQTDILGTDINPLALDEAAEGEYSDWTLRGTDGDMVAECFARVGHRWRLRPPYRRGVRFLKHNMVTEPPPLSPFGLFDVVVCRNVLMYFDEAAREIVLARLAAVMSAGAWLLVGHAEAGPQVAAHFETVSLPSCTLYRKAPSGGGQERA